MKSVVLFFIAAVIYALSWECVLHEHGVLGIVLSVIATVLGGVAAMIASSFEDRVEELERKIKELKKAERK